MSDLFHAKITDSYLDQIFAVMEQATHHTFQILTKRPGRMRAYLRARSRHQSIPQHLWFGVSVEDQHWADIRVPALLDINTPNRFLSAEPLLGAIDLTTIPDALAGVKWVIAGGESGRGARPMMASWVDALRDQCGAAQVPFFFKQAGVVLAREWGISGKGDDPSQWPVTYPQQTPNLVRGDV